MLPPPRIGAAVVVVVVVVVVVDVVGVVVVVVVDVVVVGSVVVVLELVCSRVVVVLELLGASVVVVPGERGAAVVVVPAGPFGKAVVDEVVSGLTGELPPPAVEDAAVTSEGGSVVLGLVTDLLCFLLVLRREGRFACELVTAWALRLVRRLVVVEIAVVGLPAPPGRVTSECPLVELELWRAGPEDLDEALRREALEARLVEPWLEPPERLTALRCPPWLVERVGPMLEEVEAPFVAPAPDSAALVADLPAAEPAAELDAAPEPWPGRRERCDPREPLLENGGNVTSVGMPVAPEAPAAEPAGAEEPPVGPAAPGGSVTPCRAELATCEPPGPCRLAAGVWRISVIARARTTTAPVTPAPTPIRAVRWGCCRGYFGVRRRKPTLAPNSRTGKG